MEINLLHELHHFKVLLNCRCMLRCSNEMDAVLILKDFAGKISMCDASVVVHIPLLAAIARDIIIPNINPASPEWPMLSKVTEWIWHLIFKVCTTA
jgi:hypothetical protein